MVKRAMTVLIIGMICIGLGLCIQLIYQKQQTTVTLPQDADVLLIHGYWLSQKGNGPVTLSLRSEMVAKATAILSQHYPHIAIVITAGHIWGSNYPTLGKEMADALETYGVPKKNIILQDNAIDTYDEIASFLQIAKQHGWTHFLDIAAREHDITIPTLFATQHASATYLTTESILTQYGTQQDKQAVASLSLSQYEAGLAIYEDLVRLALVVDPHYHLLGNHAHSTRNHKTPYGAVNLLPIDVYQL